MSKRLRLTLLAILLFLLALLALLFTRCSSTAKPRETVSTVPANTTAKPATPTPGPATPAENLSPATLQAPEQILAGAILHVKWTGPNNPGDYITIVAPEATAPTYGNYTETRMGNDLELSAPIKAGAYEIRYVTLRSKTILARAPITVTPVTATLEAPNEVVLGSTVSVIWTGPNNPNDFVTIVPKSTRDGSHGNYTETAKGSPLKLTVPVEPGEAELRYMTGQGAVVLARRPINIITPEISLSAPAQIEAGSVFQVEWTGPNNPADYVTIVPKDLPDGHYSNYTETAKGSPLKLTALITPGTAELRYMTGRGARVLARRTIEIAAATITLDAPDEVVAGAPVSVVWSGPGNRGDYITIVPKSLPDGQYARYVETTKGSPLRVESPIDVGPAEIRYMSGQGAKVLARRALRTVSPQITLHGPAQAKAGSTVSIDWTGPKNPGDYLTIVLKSAKDGATQQTVYVTRGSPVNLAIPPEAGAGEIRYMSGQDNRVLARAPIELIPAK